MRVPASPSILCSPSLSLTSGGSGHSTRPRPTMGGSGVGGIGGVRRRACAFSNREVTTAIIFSPQPLSTFSFLSAGAPASPSHVPRVCAGLVIQTSSGRLSVCHTRAKSAIASSPVPRNAPPSLPFSRLGAHRQPLVLSLASPLVPRPFPHTIRSSRSSHSTQGSSLRSRSVTAQSEGARASALRASTRSSNQPRTGSAPSGPPPAHSM